MKAFQHDLPVTKKKLPPADHLPEKVGGLLAGVDAELRNRKKLRPAFKRVDRIKRAKGWKPFARVPNRNPDLLPVTECAWCGEDFVNNRHDSQMAECCSRRCAYSLRKFRTQHRKWEQSMHDEQARKDLKENVEVLNRVAEGVKWIAGYAAGNGDSEGAARCEAEAEVLNGWADVCQAQLDAINDEHARGDKPNA